MFAEVDKNNSDKVAIKEFQSKIKMKEWNKIVCWHGKYNNLILIKICQLQMYWTIPLQ